MTGDEYEQGAEAEEQGIDEYVIWKKNSPLLYDTLMTHDFGRPINSIEWISPPGAKNTDRFLEKHLLVGMNQEPESDHPLIVSKVLVPTDKAILEVDNPKHRNNIKSGFNISLQSKHGGDVNKARAIPSTCKIIASFSSDASVNIYTYENHSKTTNRGPEVALHGHTQEGFGLAWNLDNKLATGSMDQSVRLWDPESESSLQCYSGDSAINEVAWRPFTPHELAAVCEDSSLIFYDARLSEPINSITASTAALNTVGYNKLYEHLLATAGAERTVMLWDTRNLSARLCTLEFHTDDIYALAWAPSQPTLLVTASCDCRAALWDLSRLQELNGTPAFVHGGHCSRVVDVCWTDEYLVASVEDNGVVHVWEPSSIMVSPHQMDLG